MVSIPLICTVLLIKLSLLMHCRVFSSNILNLSIIEINSFRLVSFSLLCSRLSLGRTCVCVCNRSSSFHRSFHLPCPSHVLLFPKAQAWSTNPAPEDMLGVSP